MFLSLLGTLSLLSAPILSTSIGAINDDIVINNDDDIDELKVREVGGEIALNKFVEAQIKAKSSTIETQDTQLLDFVIPWSSFKISKNAYTHLIWETATLELRYEIAYANNVWAIEEKPVVSPKAASYSTLDKFFKKESKIPVHETIGFDRYTWQSWDFTIYDTGVDGIKVNSRVWASARNALAWSYASIKFLDVSFYALTDEERSLIE